MKHSHEPLRRGLLYFSAWVTGIVGILVIFFLIGGLELAVNKRVSYITDIATVIAGLTIFNMAEPSKKELVSGNWNEACYFFITRALLPVAVLAMVTIAIAATIQDWPPMLFVGVGLIIFGITLGLLALSRRMGKWFSKLEVAATPEKEEPRA